MNQESWVLVPDVSLTLYVTWENTPITLGLKNFITKTRTPPHPTYFMKVLMKIK